MLREDGWVRPKRKGEKSVKSGSRRVGAGVASRGGVQTAWNTEMATIADGCRWFREGGSRFWGCARASLGWFDDGGVVKTQTGQARLRA